jgi:hypothetical protein
MKKLNNFAYIPEPLVLSPKSFQKLPEVNNYMRILLDSFKWRSETCLRLQKALGQNFVIAAAAFLNLSINRIRA